MSNNMQGQTTAARKLWKEPKFQNMLKHTALRLSKKGGYVFCSYRYPCSSLIFFVVEDDFGTVTDRKFYH